MGFGGGDGEGVDAMLSLDAYLESSLCRVRFLALACIATGLASGLTTCLACRARLVDDLSGMLDAYATFSAGHFDLLNDRACE